MRRFGHIVNLSLIVLSGSASSGQTLEEYQVKTAYMLNVAKFTDWPGEENQIPSQPFTICVVGLDPFGHWLDDEVGVALPKGRPRNVRRIASGRQAPGCRIVFLSSSERKKFTTILGDIEGQPILPMGDCDAARDAGVMVTFSRVGTRIHFEVNVDAAERQKLRISARLLSLATIVKPPN
jgi:hypothetical protein